MTLLGELASFLFMMVYTLVVLIICGVIFTAVMLTIFSPMIVIAWLIVRSV